MTAPSWWSPPWVPGTKADPDAGWTLLSVGADGSESWARAELGTKNGADVLVPLEEEFGQVRSRDRVRELAEVFTHQREIDAILDQIPDAFTAIDVKFLEPACGSGNFLVEILRRKLRLVTKEECVSQEQYEHRLLRVLAAIYGIDISMDNVTEARSRMAHVLLGHYQAHANTIEPSTAFVGAAATILGANLVVGDTMTAADRIELCDWQPAPAGGFRRVWSCALVPPGERDLFWAERVEDHEPVHFSALMPPPAPARHTGTQA